jgi:iron complex outermembrane receptor protein
MSKSFDPRIARATTLGISSALCVFMPNASLAQQAVGATLEEVVVTAQRRAERQVDVPITVTSVTGDQLVSSGVDATGNLGQVVPAFRMDYNGAFAQPAIRGVSTAVANVGGGSAVGVYVDGFYNPSPLTSDFSLLNVSSIQVLKGPQGTLFGRNTTAGAVLVQTADPTQDLRLQARASYGNYNAADTAVYISGGITEKLAVDFAGQYSRGDGYVTNLVDDDDRIGEYENSSFRVGAKLDINDSDYLLLRYAYSYRDDPTSVNWGVYKDDSGQYQAAVGPAIFGRHQGEIGTNLKPAFTSRVEQTTLTGKFDIGFADLTSLSMYREELSFSDMDLDSSQADILHVNFHNSDRTITQEFLLNSKPDSGALTWVAGAFYMDQTAGQPDSFLESVGGANLGYQVKDGLNIKSYAVFFDATYQLAEQWFLTAGGRYSDETDEGYWNGCSAPTCVTAPPGYYTLDDKWTDFSPRLAVRYQLDDYSNIYGSWTEGFKAGLVDVNGFREESIGAESIEAYEVGYKFARGGTRLELSTFYYDYSDLQVSNYEGIVAVTNNAASSEVYGAEISGAQQLTESLTLSGGVAFTHGRYEKYPAAPANVFTPFGVSNLPAVDVSGNHMTRSPDITGNVTLNYAMSVAGGELNLNGNLYYSSKVYFDAANNNEQSAYTLVNLRASWMDPSQHWTFGVWGNNVTDEEYLTQVLSSGPTASVSWGAPATYGISIDYRY